MKNIGVRPSCQQLTLEITGTVYFLWQFQTPTMAGRLFHWRILPKTTEDLQNAADYSAVIFKLLTLPKS
jgi:hypothetical protein